MRRLPSAYLTLFAVLLVLSSGCAKPSAPSAGPGAVQPEPVLAAVESAVTDPTVSTPSTTAQTIDDGGTAVLEEDDTIDTAEGPEGILDAALELMESAQEFWTQGEGDQAIEALDRAYAAILTVPGDAGTKEQQQQKEDLRFMISKRIMEIYASRFTATNGKAKEIPLVVNEHVEREIRLFQGPERDFFLESYRRSGRYREMLVKAFREAGLPDDLAWLPLIESGFKVKALSRARALGLWQFIPSTGYKFGLKRTAVMDERMDPEKSTAAAIAYLRELHQIFGDWATVLAAYNCGEGAVLRVIRSQKVNYLDNFWDLYERLPRETARYYPRFLAVLAILKDPDKYGFVLEEPEKPAPYDVVTVEKPVHLKKVAEKIGCSDEELSGLNPELRLEATPGSPYDLKVPLGKKEAVLACLDSLPKWSPPRLAYVVHRVRRGETLSSIAMYYRTSVQRIMDLNNLRRGRLIRVGQRLKIPLRGAS